MPLYRNGRSHTSNRKNSGNSLRNLARSSRTKLGRHANVLLLISLAIAASLSLLHAETSARPEGVGVDQQLGRTVPLDLLFKDESGQAVPLRSLFKEGKPLLVAPSYFECIRLCTYIYNGIGKAIQATPTLLPGRDYTILSLSINPDDTTMMARMKGQNYREALVDAGGPSLKPQDWQFITGSEQSIRAFTDAVGFRFKRDGKDFSHPAALVLITPEGRISRYLFGIEFEPRDYRLSLVEASGGQIGNPVDAVLLSCFRYDVVQGKYAPFAWGFMRLGALATLVLLVGFLLFLRKQRTQ